MMSFKYFNVTKKFVCLYFTTETSNRLREWAISKGFDLATSFSGEPQSVEQFDFHLTIYFTTTEHNTPNQTTYVTPFELKLDHFELLGANLNIPVIKVQTDNTQLMSIRNMFTQRGYKDAWPEYKPHISLSYNYSGKPSIDTLQLPDFAIVADRYVVKDQK